MVNVHEFLFADGTSFGCGTALELAYWQREGIVDPEAKLGKVIGTEPASEDERRKTLWGIGDFMNKVAA